MTSVELIVKATRLCNLRCTYCYDWRAGEGNTMSFRTLARLVARTLRHPDHRTVGFDWHGGEPTVLPLSFFEKALHLQRRFRRPDQLVRNAIQTNATRITPEWARFFADHHIDVGISIDGPSAVHDRYRVDRGGRPTLARTLDGLRQLRDHGIEPGVGVVVDRAALQAGPAALLDFLDEHRIRAVGLNFVMPDALADDVGHGDGRHYVDPDQSARFLMGLYDCWRKRDGTEIHVRELAALVDSLHGTRPSPCTLAGQCFGIVFRIEPNGDVHHCDYFGEDPQYHWGNINTDDFSAIRQNANLQDRTAAHAEERKRLRSCDEFPVCHGWCPHVRYTSRRHYEGHRDDCCGLRPLIAHIRENPPSGRAAATMAQI
ncbi:radical SAM protein [Streptomyces sp. CJ_13]|uniref:radical SAM/SPASM domain-containing protein n=1 Tax=Streptomyces sp. CJ_13 TaxID=2724943 RepID=UPI001BDD0825|nr:radical SAM protein [Streptomyces sp. CJ_13]MBT1185150.1 radical SAM protein [Streptomyces sp. CJ_13]